jgi:hypothetical protein
MDPAVDRHAVIAGVVAESPELQAIEDADSRAIAAWAAFATKLFREVSRNPGAARDMLKFKSGQEPTTFVLGVIPPEQANRIEDECKGKPDEHNWRAFLASTREVQGWPEQTKKIRVGEVDYVDPVWLVKNFPRGLRKVALDVGFVAWHWNQLREDEAKN